MEKYIWIFEVLAYEKKRNRLCDLLFICVAFTIFGIYFMITFLGNEISQIGTLALLMFSGTGLSVADMSQAMPIQNGAKLKRISKPMIALSAALLLDAGYSFWATSKSQDVNEWVLIVVSVVVCIGLYFFTEKPKSKK